ncbi:MAG: hypothetical protein WCL02_05700 [bacterium]
MKKFILIVFSIFALLYVTSCCQQTPKSSIPKPVLTPTIGVAILDTVGKIADYDWTKVKTTGNISTLPTGVIAYFSQTKSSVYQTEDQVTMVRQILSAFETKFNVQVLSTSPITPSRDGVDCNHRHIVLNVIHQPKDTITSTILRSVTLLLKENADLKKAVKLQSREIMSLKKEITPKQ